MSARTRAHLIRRHPLGGYEGMDITSLEQTSGTEFGVTVIAPPSGGAMVGDARSVPAATFEAMQEAYDREIAAARADGWEVEFTEQDSPGLRHVRTPAAGMR